MITASARGAMTCAEIELLIAHLDLAQNLIAITENPISSTRDDSWWYEIMDLMDDLHDAWIFTAEKSPRAPVWPV